MLWLDKVLNTTGGAKVAFLNKQELEVFKKVNFKAEDTLMVGAATIFTSLK